MSNSLETQVFQAYGAGFNVSVTTRGGYIVKATKWQTGKPGSTASVSASIGTVFAIDAAPRKAVRKAASRKVKRTRKVRA
jgi:hypothetical protein